MRKKYLRKISTLFFYSDYETSNLKIQGQSGILEPDVLKIKTDVYSETSTVIF